MRTHSRACIGGLENQMGCLSALSEEELCSSEVHLTLF